MKVLFIVDPQNDFVDPAGSLYVKGAEAAIDNICKLLKERDFDRVIVSQDSHQYYHIGHSEFWKEKPEPGTVIKISEISRNEFVPALCDYENSKDVIRRIYERNSRDIRIWPHHCIEGSWGYSFPDRLVQALNDWSASHLRPYEVYQKGKNPFCESFSLLDEYTPDFNGTILFSICGFCKDICVYETLKAIVDADILPRYLEKLELIEECSTAFGEDGEELNNRFKKIFEKLSKRWSDSETDDNKESYRRAPVEELNQDPEAPVEEAGERDDVEMGEEAPDGEVIFDQQNMDEAPAEEMPRPAGGRAIFGAN